MTPEEQLERFGLAAVGIQGRVMVIDQPPGTENNVRTTMSPREFRRFLYEGAHALFVAEAYAELARVAAIEVAA